MAHGTLVGAVKPSLQEGNAQVRDLQFMRGNHEMPVAGLRQGPVSRPVIGANRAGRFNGLLGKAAEGLLGGVWNDSHPDTSNPCLAFVLHAYHHKYLSQGATTSFARFLAAHIGFIYLDSPIQPISARPYHRTPQFMQPRPSGLVASELQNALDTLGACPILLAHDPPDGAEPKRQRLTRVLKDRPCCHRRLVLAVSTAQKSTRRPTLRAATAGTSKAVRPAQRRQVTPTGIIRRESLLKFDQIPRVRIHRTAHYRLWLRQSNGYPSNLNSSRITVASRPRFRLVSRHRAGVPYQDQAVARETTGAPAYSTGTESARNGRDGRWREARCDQTWEAR